MAADPKVLEYQRTQIKQIRLGLCRNTEQDVIDRITSQPNQRQYIIRLVRDDIAKDQQK